MARRPVPTARAACSGRATHTGSTAEAPAIARVASQLPSASAPRSSTSGTGLNRPAHSIRSASLAKSLSGVPAAAYFT